jgi:DNA-binding transcriptional regulator of glucitol operon
MSDSPSIGNTALTRTLCAVIVLIMIAAVLYTAWIGISNFSRIAV